MNRSDQSQITRILNEAGEGRQGATEELFELLYSHLRQMAQKKMSEEKPGQTLQATALVNEAFLKLVGSAPTQWENRNHFFAAASEAMRRILIDIARKKKAEKRGGEAVRFELSAADKIGFPVADEILDLNQALNQLEEHDPVKAQLVKLRFFAGFTSQEAADLLGIGLSTAERYWTYSKAWLHQSVAQGKKSEG